MATRITEQYVDGEGLKYFRDDAPTVEMGSWGEKKDPLGPKSHLDVHNKVDSDHRASRVKFTTRANLNSSRGQGAMNRSPPPATYRAEQTTQLGERSDAMAEEMKATVPTLSGTGTLEETD